MILSILGGLIISHLNELGHILELDKQYFDAQSKIILSFKLLQAVLLQQCLDKCKHLSLQETASLIQPVSSLPRWAMHSDSYWSPRWRILYVSSFPPWSLICLSTHCRPTKPFSRISEHVVRWGLDVRSIWICLRNAKKKDSDWLEYTTEEKKEKRRLSIWSRDLWNLKRYHGVIIFTVSIRQRIQPNSINPKKDAYLRNVHICPGRFSGTEKESWII